MKNIAIITFHRALNYGAVLQSYALQNFLNNNGYATKILDYRNEFFEETYHLFSPKQLIKKRISLKQLLIKIVEEPFRKKIERKFECFNNKHLLLSEVVDKNDLYKLNNQFDYFITGSDQVWNLDATNGDTTYLLDFADSNKRNSFAASIGEYKLRDLDINILKNYNYISVRENETKAMLEDFGLSKSIVHLDPVFLIEKNDWNQLASSRIIKENYILIFTMGKNIDLCNYAFEYARSHGVKLYYLSNNIRRVYRRGIKNIYVAGPDEFLSYIKYADYVFTDSFHGTAFSALFEKAFYCHITGKKSDERMINLVESLGIKNCIESQFIGRIPQYSISNYISENKDKVISYFNNIDLSYGIDK